MTPRVAVFLDYQNVHLSARTAFLPSGSSGRHGHVDPMRVARRIVRGRRFDGELATVRVYRGRPSPDHQPVAARASDRQADRWSRDSRVVLVRRQLRYPKAWPAEPAQEKGIDVALAVDLVRLACEGAYDVGVLFSRDTDLVPALETVRDLGCHVEVASWKGTSRLRFPDSQLPWCHYLDADDYAACRDYTDYTAA
ncbi:NYN domain-containing protein [Pseudofrankia sp. DC12]|uniref:NYN domain-containing protein n=1 Tax=Pseudofrankia sp. DC12 TaxID=683315 RepID=UPI000A03A999|nr:NYN domain-containing protein [Pseudofrankia sp. DC12]